MNGSRTAILIGNGDGTFRAPFILTEPLMWVPQCLAIADYNRDGKSDIALALADGTWGLMDIWHGHGGGTFLPSVMYFVLPSKSSIGGGVLVSADFNGDGKPDVALQVVGASPGLVVAVNATGGTAPAPATVTVASLTLAPTTVTGGSSAT